MNKKRLIALIVSIVLVVGIVCSGISIAGSDIFCTTPQIENDKPLPMPNDELSLAWNLRKFMPEDQNYIYSPLSLEMALALIANGAEGETLAEIETLLLGGDLEVYNGYAKRLVEEYAKNQRITLKLANSVWLNRDHPSQMQFLSDYRDEVKEYFGAEAGEVTKHDALSQINGWVSENTNGKIKNILTKQMVENPEFLACLVNALYFQGEWETRFKSHASYKGIFTDKNGKTTETTFMTQTLYADYYSDDTVQMVKLPYRDRDFSMYFVLGETENPELLIEKMENKRVELKIPKFKTETSLTLDAMLKQMGMTRAYDKIAAQFGGMTTGNPNYNTYLMTVLQKSYIEINEEGTEAAAVTAGVMAATSALMPQEEPVKFYADKPFTYFIRDDKNGQLLFVGEYVFCK